MKKISIIILVLSFFSVHSYAHATSGACSYHGGVNCSAGASWDGNAMCNDGTESTVQYSEMDECMNTTPSCTVDQATWNQAKQKADSIMNEMQNNLTQFQASANQIINGTNSYSGWQQSLINSTNQSFNQIDQSAQNKACILTAETTGAPCSTSNSSASNNANPIQSATIAGMQNQFNEGNYNQLKASFDLEQSMLQDEYKNEQNILSCSIQQPTPTPSTPTTISTDQSCKQQFGINSVVSPRKVGYCSCADGYQFNSTNSQCIPIPETTCPAGYTCSSVTSQTPLPVATVPTVVQPSVQVFVAPKIIKKKPSTIIHAATTTSVTTASTTTIASTTLIESVAVSTSTLISSSTTNTPVEKSWYRKLYDYLFHIL